MIGVSMGSTWGFRTCSETDWGVDKYEAISDALINYEMYYQLGQKQYYCEVKSGLEGNFGKAFESEQLNKCSNPKLIGECAEDYWIQISIPTTICISSLVINDKELAIEPLIFHGDAVDDKTYMAMWDWFVVCEGYAMPELRKKWSKNDVTPPAKAPKCPPTYAELSSFYILFSTQAFAQYHIA